MAYQTTQAIVLRRVDYRDNDRILTLLTPERGRLDVLARGCRRPKSPLLAASELFSMGEYVLYKGRGHAFIVSCELS
ncbi:MAG: DNA repair protein RecO, partial [Clostridiales bacterium]|nr:DNA repair protein RecO [Clostridiales bacterium]